MPNSHCLQAVQIDPACPYVPPKSLNIACLIPGEKRTFISPCHVTLKDCDVPAETPTHHFLCHDIKGDICMPASLAVNPSTPTQEKHICYKRNLPVFNARLPVYPACVTLFLQLTEEVLLFRHSSSVVKERIELRSFDIFQSHVSFICSILTHTSHEVENVALCWYRPWRR